MEKSVELVVKLPEEIVSFVYTNGYIPFKYNGDITGAIMDGIELPAKHGDLVDMDELLRQPISILPNYPEVLVIVKGTKV